jgi:hypothetical protein
MSPAAVLERHRRRSCDGKRAYGASAARGVAAAMRERGERVDAYPCIFCPSWHVGHQPGMATVRMLANAMRGLG